MGEDYIPSEIICGSNRATCRPRQLAVLSNMARKDTLDSGQRGSKRKQTARNDWNNHTVPASMVSRS